MKSASYDSLLTGSTSFKNRVFSADRPRFESLAKGQSPKVTFLTCSDSRIDPCALTGAQAGDLFVIRNAGNIVPEQPGGTSGELATLEFAVRALNTEHIVVCGHTDCGAMKGLLAPDQCAHLPHVSSWVRQAQGALVALDGADADPKRRLERVIQANVRLQLENMRKLDFIQDAEAAGKLQLHGWLYDIGVGEVVVLEESSNPEIRRAA
ncbi:MAG: carbonic anhydrase [Limisphaerales bacterium]|jgi:carbonic anhydrase